MENHAAIRLSLTIYTHGASAQRLGDGAHAGQLGHSPKHSQGCVLAPTPFSLVSSAMLIDAYRDERPGIHITCITDDNLNIRGRQAASHVSFSRLDDSAPLTTGQSPKHSQ
ncbi:unnamed protein product [Schistocephalus solidus]|uniref:DUF222 domain-containing protein n=1 Tax=Schistocephalus solidus TaxID=70667 RepID=A0A183SXZ7_SCHSO|nr:unnamed protein product [Schistocephalus solidus]